MALSALEELVEGVPDASWAALSERQRRTIEIALLRTGLRSAPWITVRLPRRSGRSSRLPAEGARCSSSDAEKIAQRNILQRINGS